MMTAYDNNLRTNVEIVNIDMLRQAHISGFGFKNRVLFAPPFATYIYCGIHREVKKKKMADEERFLNEVI